MESSRNILSSHTVTVQDSDVLWNHFQSSVNSKGPCEKGLYGMVYPPTIFWESHYIPKVRNNDFFHFYRLCSDRLYKSCAFLHGIFQLICMILALSTCLNTFSVVLPSDDWNAVTANLQNMIPTIPETLISNIITIYITSARDTQQEVNSFITVSWGLIF